MIDLQYRISLRYTTQWLDILIYYEMITTISLVTIYSCHNIIDYTPHTIHYIYPHDLLFGSTLLVGLN